MDARQRQIFDKAQAILDRRDDDARKHRDWLERHYDPITERVDLGEDEPRDELVFKTHTTQPRVDQWAGWNAWADSRIAKFLNDAPFTEMQRETLAEVIAELRQEWEQYVDDKLGELRTQAGNVEQLVRKTNVA